MGGRFAKWRASMITSPSFASSAGWKLSDPYTSQERLPRVIGASTRVEANSTRVAT